MDKYSKIIQESLDKFKENPDTDLNVNEVLESLSYELNGTTVKNMLNSCGLFQFRNNKDDYFLSYKGLEVSTNYKGDYSEYRKSLKPVSRRLISGSALSNIFLVIVIIVQSVLLYRQDVRETLLFDSDVESQKQQEKTILLLEKILADTTIHF